MEIIGEIRVIVQKQYRFKLQSVLDYRERQLNAVQQKVAQEENRRMQIVSRIAECDTVIGEAFREQQISMAGELDLMRMQNFPHYILRLREQRAEACQALRVQERRVAVVREELHQALIRKKALETLKNKDFARYRREAEQVEAAFLEEIALSRAVRNVAPLS